MKKVLNFSGAGFNHHAISGLAFCGKINIVPGSDEGGIMRCVALSVVLSGILLPAGLCADPAISLNSKHYRAQTRVLDDRARSQYNNAVRLEPQRIYTPTKWGPPPGEGGQGSYRGPYYHMAKDAARRHNIPEDLFIRLVRQESGWNPTARSHKGAIGLAQLMPGTARKLRVNPHDPYENLEGGARYLAMQYRSFGNWQLALAAYNAGPDAVRKYKGVPPYNETVNYVRVIWGNG